jgi:hypothetical protein
MSSVEVTADAASESVIPAFTVPTTPTAALFWVLLRHYQTTLGLGTVEALERMISDPALPGMLDPPDVAAIQGIQARSLKPQRRLKKGPPFIRQSGTVVRYPTVDFVRYLIARAR